VASEVVFGGGDPEEVMAAVVTEEVAM